MKKRIATALLCSAALSPALAQNSRYYGALDYGTLSMSGPGTYASPGALSLSGGYRYLPHISLEAGLTLIGNATADIPGSGRVSVSQSIVSAVALGTAPVNAHINVFGKAGLGLHNGELNGLPDSLIFGFGAQVLLDPKTSVRMQYESLGRARIPSTSSRADLTRLSIGVTYDF